MNRCPNTPNTNSSEIDRHGYIVFSVNLFDFLIITVMCMPSLPISEIYMLRGAVGLWDRYRMLLAAIYAY